GCDVRVAVRLEVKGDLDGLAAKRAQVKQRACPVVARPTCGGVDGLPCACPYFDFQGPGIAGGAFPPMPEAQARMLRRWWHDKYSVAHHACICRREIIPIQASADATQSRVGFTWSTRGRTYGPSAAF